MKKSLGWFLMVVFLIVTISVFGEKVKITWWYESVTPTSLKAIEDNLIKPYEDTHPNVKIDILVKNQLQEVLRTAIIAGEGPDIIMTMGPAEANRFAAAGYLYL